MMQYVQILFDEGKRQLTSNYDSVPITICTISHLDGRPKQKLSVTVTKKNISHSILLVRHEIEPVFLPVLGPSPSPH